VSVFPFVSLLLLPFSTMIYGVSTLLSHTFPPSHILQPAEGGAKSRGRSWHPSRAGRSRLRPRLFFPPLKQPHVPGTFVPLPRPRPIGIIPAAANVTGPRSYRALPFLTSFLPFDHRRFFLFIMSFRWASDCPLFKRGVSPAVSFPLLGGIVLAASQEQAASIPQLTLLEFRRIVSWTRFFSLRVMVRVGCFLQAQRSSFRQSPPSRGGGAVFWVVLPFQHFSPLPFPPTLVGLAPPLRTHLSLLFFSCPLRSVFLFPALIVFFTRHCVCQFRFFSWRGWDLSGASHSLVIRPGLGSVLGRFLDRSGCFFYALCRRDAFFSPLVDHDTPVNVRGLFLSCSVPFPPPRRGPRVLSSLFFPTQARWLSPAVVVARDMALHLPPISR